MKPEAGVVPSAQRGKLWLGFLRPPRASSGGGLQQLVLAQADVQAGVIER